MAFCVKGLAALEATPDLRLIADVVFGGWFFEVLVVTLF